MLLTAWGVFYIRVRSRILLLIKWWIEFNIGLYFNNSLKVGELLSYSYIKAEKSFNNRDDYFM